MRESLYPKERYPQGHPYLARSLNDLGCLLRTQGSYGDALGYFERGLAMRESLYPKDRYPNGHPDLANSLDNLGFLLQAQGSYGKARGYFERALAIRTRVALPKGALPPRPPRCRQQPQQNGCCPLRAGLLRRCEVT